MAKQPNAPLLRFPEFNSDWSCLKYGSIFSFRSTNSFSRENLNYADGQVKNIHYGDIHTKFSTLFDITNEEVPFVNPEIELKNVPDDNYCRIGDLILADASEDYADVGKCIEIVNLNNEKVVSGLHTILARPDLHKMAIGFNGFLMQSEKVRLQIKTIAQGSKVLSISTKRIAEISLNIPQNPEQQKIASFLTAIDTKLTQLKQKKSLLEQYKKGVIQKIFSQEIRFKDENGAEYPKWEKKKLSDIADKIMYGMNAAAIAYDGENKYVRITDIDENSRAFIPNPLTSPDGVIEEKYKLKESDILFTRTGASVGKSYLYNRNDGNLLFAGFLIKFSIINGNPYFIFSQTLLESYNKWIQLMSMRSGQPGINAEEYKSFSIKFPCLAEQTKIANFLSALDEKINHCQLQIEKMVKYKKGLLQKMFC